MEKSGNIIKLSSTETFYTHNRDDAFKILKGSVIVYIVPWTNSSRTAGRKYSVGEYEEGSLIPAFSYRDLDYTNWRFAFLSKGEELEFEVMPDLCTNVLRNNFLKKLDLKVADYEGYDAALVELCNRELLKDSIVIQRGVKSKPQLEDASVKVMKKALNEGKHETFETHNELYDIMQWACTKKKLPLASPDKINAACGDDPTVAEVARLSNIICRSVVLDANWYHSDCGIIIGKIDGHYVACVPNGSKGYVIYGREQGVCKLNAKIAGQIEPKAFSIGRALPQAVVDKKALKNFIFASITKRDIVYVVILGFVGSLIGILIPLLNQKIYDDYIPLGEKGILVQMCILIGAFMIGNIFLTLVKKLFEFNVSCHIAYDIQNALYCRIFQLPESFFRKHDSADLAQRLIKTETIANQFITTILVTGFSFVFSFVYLFQMLSYSGNLTLIGILMAAVYGVIIYILNGMSLRYEKKITEVDGKAASKLYQYLGGIEKVRMAGVEERFVLEYLKPYAEKQMHSIKRNRIASAGTILLEIATYIFSMVLYTLIIKDSIDISTGSFIAFTSAFGVLSSSILELTNGIISVRRLKPDYMRLKPILDVKPENDEGKEIVKSLNGKIKLDKITFAYDSTERNILDQLSLEINSGEYVAIVGPSGCGKSTLLKLMLGFEKPDKGKIYYDGKDLAALDKHSLRRNLGVVLQNGKLISGSIYDNVTITAPHVAMKDVNKTLEAVGLKDDIAAMPMGIHTVLSESGGTISGGQQQRILIARSIMNNPSILFFDEATSALDNLTQAKVCSHLDGMNVTRIVIAHRLSTIKNCDRIIVIKEGKLVEEGNYESLMKLKGLFYQMASRQIAE